MAFDIRQAKKAGIIPPKEIVSEKSDPKIADLDTVGNFTLNSITDYDGDIVIASYMEFLNKNDITEEDIQNVLSALLTSGNVEWQFNLLDKIPVIFTVRPAWVDDYIAEVLDNLISDNSRVSNVRYNNLVAECNLAASLKKFNKEVYTINSRTDLDAARTRIQNMPYVLQNALVKKLAVFERTIAAATSDWAVKNFMTTQKEK